MIETPIRGTGSLSYLTGDGTIGHTHAAGNPAVHFPALDGLRGIAILLVVWHHALIFSRDSRSIGQTLVSHLGLAGWVGVDLFFVLSGFLITRILLRSQGSRGWLQNFYMRRALRVLPLYYLVILFCFNGLVWWPHPGLDWIRQLAPDQGWYWLHLANFRRMLSVLDPASASVGWFSTYWSLSIEEQFYLGWPMVLLAVGPGRLGTVALLGVLLVNVLRVATVYFEWGEQVLYYNTLTRVDGLFLGSWLGWKSVTSGLESGRQGWAKLVFTLAIFAFVVPMLIGYPGGGRSTIYGMLCLYPASVFGSAALLWMLLAPDGLPWGVRLVSASWLRSFGAYSYAIYVFNKPILAGYQSLWRAVWGPLSAVEFMVALMLAAASCWLVGALSWRLIESPFLSLKRYFPNPWTATATPQVEQSPSR